MTPKAQAIDYGVDAPGVRGAMRGIGFGGAAVSALALTGASRGPAAFRVAAGIATFVGAAASVYGFGMAAYMTYASRIGKLRTRERLLDIVGELSPWTGRERVLDVGCGRGLMLVGAAQRLTSGEAIGVDLWRDEDQSSNSAIAAHDNARRAGVADRVKIETADARTLPFADASFDVVLSHWVVHNIKAAADRTRAVDEMIRVLKPGGVLALADIANHADYRSQLTARGFYDRRSLTGGLETTLIGALSGGSFRPQSLIVKRP